MEHSPSLQKEEKEVEEVFVPRNTDGGGYRPNYNMSVGKWEHFIIIMEIYTNAYRKRLEYKSQRGKWEYFITHKHGLNLHVCDVSSGVVIENSFRDNQLRGKSESIVQH